MHALHTHTHTKARAHTHPYSHTLTHPYTLTPVHTHTCTHAHRLLVHTCTPTHTHVHARSLAHVHTHTGSSGSQDPSWGAPVPWAGSVDTGQNRRHPGPHRPHTKLPLTRSHTSSGRDSHLAGWVAEAGRGSARTPSALGTPRGPALCSSGTRRVIVPTPSEVRTGVTSTSPTKTPRAGEAQWLTPSHAASWGACAPPPGAAAALVWRSEGARWPRGGSGGGGGEGPQLAHTPLSVSLSLPLPRTFFYERIKTKNLRRPVTRRARGGATDRASQAEAGCRRVPTPPSSSLRARPPAPRSPGRRPRGPTALLPHSIPAHPRTFMFTHTLTLTQSHVHTRCVRTRLGPTRRGHPVRAYGGWLPPTWALAPGGRPQPPAPRQLQAERPATRERPL